MRVSMWLQLCQHVRVRIQHQVALPVMAYLRRIVTSAVSAMAFCALKLTGRLALVVPSSITAK